jgi:hypothetical protein
MEIIHTYCENHVLGKITVRDLLNMQHIGNWKFNRPPDYIRCKEIAKYIFTKRPCLDWLFYAVGNGNSRAFSIIDGIHRFTAFKLIHTENSKPCHAPDLLTPNEFAGDLSWFYQQHVLISLRTNTSEGEEVDLFRQINMSNPVPDLYIQNPDYEKRCLIEETVKTWTDQYRAHFSANSKPNVPNVNRDRFIELLNFLCDKHGINKSNNPQKLEELLYEMNHKIRQNLPKRISQKSLDKCGETGCYLFLVKQDILQELFDA